jgi:hypothetical protein
MAARDRYTSDVTCPECGNRGVLHISEDDYPFMRNLHRSVDRVDGEFIAEVDRDNTVNVTCKCGSKVR